MSYDVNTGTFAVHTHVRDMKRAAELQRIADRANALPPDQKCKLQAEIDRKNYVSTAKQRDADLKAMDKREIKAYEARKKQGAALVEVVDLGAPETAAVPPTPNPHGTPTVPSSPGRTSPRARSSLGSRRGR